MYHRDMGIIIICIYHGVMGIIRHGYHTCWSDVGIIRVGQTGVSYVSWRHGYHVDMCIIRVSQAGVSYVSWRQGYHTCWSDRGIIRVGQTWVSCVLVRQGYHMYHVDMCIM